jgi:short-subunit dehydrogenase
MKTVLILGANSAMARALARKLAGPQTHLILAGRNLKELELSAADLEIRTHAPQPLVAAFNALDLDSHEDFLKTMLEKIPSLDEVYLFFGQMAEQAEAQKDFQMVHEMLMANYVGAVSILERIAGRMEAQKRGLIVGVSSVAGDRGRQSNYLYGSSKAGLTAYLQGLRNRLAHSNVRVLTVKPGMVDTPMTSHMKKGLLFSKPEQIAQGILAAVRKGKDVVYLPWYWRWIMLIIRSIPEPVFKKMKM